MSRVVSILEEFNWTVLPRKRKRNRVCKLADPNQARATASNRTTLNKQENRADSSFARVGCKY